jgi:hypothetical protein
MSADEIDLAVFLCGVVTLTEEEVEDDEEYTVQ